MVWYTKVNVTTLLIVYYLLPKGLNDEQTLSLLTNNICAQLVIAGAKVRSVLENSKLV